MEPGDRRLAEPPAQEHRTPVPLGGEVDETRVEVLHDATELVDRVDAARHARVVALPQPTEREKGQWHFQRYIERLMTNRYLILPTVQDDLHMSWFVFVVRLNDLFEPGESAA